MTYGIAIQTPETPISEEWAWLTDLSTSYNGTEDRIPLLRYPRRTFSGNYRFDTKDSLRRHLAMMTKRFRTEFQFPLFQYQVKLKAKVAVGAMGVVVNTRRGDFRVGATALIIEGDTFEQVVVSAITNTSLEFQAPLNNAYSPRAVVCPVVTVFTNTNASVTRANPDHSATSSFTFVERMPTLPFVSPLNSASVAMFDGLPVLAYRAMGTGFEANVATGLTAVEYTGLIDIVSPWNFEQWAQNVSFKVGNIGLNYSIDLSAHFPILTPGDEGYPPAGTFYPKALTIGPFSVNVEVVAGTASGDGYVQPEDWLYLNGVQTSAEVDVNYPAGTVLYTLPAGNVLTVQVKNRDDGFCGLYGNMTVRGTPGLEWWQAFGDAVQGSANPFLFPTNRSDLEVVTPATAGTNQVTVEGDEYNQHYWGHGAFSRIFIDSDVGRHFAKVTGIVSVGGNDRLTFDPPLPGGADWTKNQRVGFLLKVRNDNDKITLNHYGLWTEVGMAIRTVE